MQEVEEDSEHRWRVLGLVALTLAIVGIYGRSFSRGFVSEDFIILRLLSEGSLLGTAIEQLSGPWLGISFFAFYRPFGTIVLQAEWQLFGTWTAGYLVVHLLAHLIATLLVARLVRRLMVTAGGESAASGGVVALLVAAVFGLGPLGPNTVSFIASFATLFSTLAALAAVAGFFAWRGAPGRASIPWAAVVWTAVALGTYEGAVVLPALILAIDLLFSAASGVGGRRRRATAHLALWGLLILYVLVRAAALGTLIGGYPDLAVAVTSGRLGELAGRLSIDFSRLILPTWGAFHPGWLGNLIDVALIVGSAAAVASWRRDWARLWWLGLVWIYCAQLPYGAASIVPANGRYAYLGAIGVGLLAAAAVTALSPARFRLPALVAATLTAAVVYGGLLTVSVAAHVEAGARATDFRKRLAALAGGQASPVFVAGEPEFVTHTRGPFAGVPIAQIFHWGLADALMPPFESTDLRVYPLPRLTDAGLAPWLARGEGTMLRVAGQSDLVIVPRPVVGVPRASGLTVARSASATAHEYQVDGLPAGSRARAVIVARGHPDIRPAEAFRRVDQAADAAAIVRLPRTVIETMSRLWNGPIYWWVEARDASGAVVAWSAAEEVSPAAETER